VPISEVFYSIAGEGFEVGTPISFVRFSFCNLRCKGCDTQYSWVSEGKLGFRRILDKLKMNMVNTVFITGGEPMVCRELFDFLRMLKRHGYKIILQTNGTRFDSRIFSIVDYISCDIKTPCFEVESDDDVIKKLDMNYKEKLQYKFIISNERDWKYSVEKIKRLSEGSRVVFQPYFLGKEPDLRGFYDWILPKIKTLKGVNVRIIPQLHRLIWGNVRGV
jgi:7-carboxy-7-deazaguanine synthase